MLDALLVADVGVNAVETREAGLVGRDVQPRLGHHGQQAPQSSSATVLPPALGPVMSITV